MSPPRLRLHGRVGLKNHAATHNRESLQDKSVPLSSAPPRQYKSTLAQLQRSMSSSTCSKGLDIKNPQKVQSMYRWNIRKCLRAIANDDSQGCTISKERVQEHFKAIWEKPCPIVNEVSGRIPSPTLQDTPHRPPVLEFLSPKNVAASLRPAENSAPGPDLISYKHWREIDPSCKVL
ncbi:hypothetical protein TNIN_34011 [Trichonephila inaurata madagascariensis]|uniref:Uncharacterized protein n=1 Tax=Trichonephila inaurata madagascariensis TaxID=2747483 RepID=A0A8X6MBU0_9ARAC|nr:hypothetical protein TNIN_34011 [Trichonephila inaurata madagascariensis]